MALADGYIIAFKTKYDVYRYWRPGDLIAGPRPARRQTGAVLRRLTPPRRSPAGCLTVPVQHKIS
jgi:hypothetical protein